MTATHSARVHLTGPGRGTVTVDGVDLHKVRSIAVDATAGEVTRLTVELVIHEAEIDGEMIVIIPPATAATLAALGWAPPSGQPIDSPEQAHAFRHTCGTLQDGAPGENGAVCCPGCRSEMYSDDPVPRYVLVQIGGGPDGAAG